MDADRSAALDVEASAALDLGLCPDAAIRRAAVAAPRALAWSRAGLSDPGEWQETARGKLVELAGYGRFGGPPGIVHRRDLGTRDGLRHQALYVRVRHGHDIPVRVVWDGDGPGGPRPAALCVQGEGFGMRVSWGEANGPEQRRAVAQGLDLGRQAARRGYLAVCVELAGAGERTPRTPGADGVPRPDIMAAHALVLGRCLSGERASDISSVLNWVLDGDFGFDLDVGRVVVLGHGTGGFAALLAAALDLRIAGVAVINALGLMRAGLTARTLDLAYVVPGLLRWFDLDDVIALCAPRPVLALSRRDHPIWPAAEAAEAMREAGKVYALLEAPDALAAESVDGTGAAVEQALWRLFPAVLAAGPAAPGAAEQPAQQHKSTGVAPETP